MMPAQRIEFTGSSGDALAARLDFPPRPVRAYAVFTHCFTCSKDIFAAQRIASEGLLYPNHPPDGKLARNLTEPSQDTTRLMVFKLISAASRTWRRLQGENQLLKIIQGVKFRDGIEVTVLTSHSAA